MSESEPHRKLNLEPRFAFVGTPSDVSPAGIRRWIADVTARLEITPTELARKAGLAPSTLNRFLAETDPTRNLSGRTITALIRAGQEMANFPDPLTFDHLSAFDDESSTSTYLVEIIVLGVVKDEFLPEIQWEPEDTYTVKLPIPAPYHRHSLLALEVGDSHASKIYPFGSLVIAIPFDSLHRGPVHGEKVVVLEINENDWVKASIFEYLQSPSNDGWLIPLGHEAGIERYVGQAAGPGRFWEKKNFRIAAKIIASYQPDRSINAGSISQSKE
jgi:hypothetical protein